MNQPNTRHTLIVRLKGDDERAWVDFVERYEPFLRHLASRHGVPVKHVADVVQQVLLAIAKSVDGWKDDGKPGSFRRWMATVARNVAIKFMTRERKQAAASGGSEFIDMLQQVPSRPDRDQIHKYEHELIVWAAEQVRHEFIASSWAAFWGTAIDGRPVADVARELGVSAGSIYMSRGRIMARIRSKVAEVLEAPGE